VVTNGSGTVTSGNVTNVTVTCTTNQYKIGGTVTGLTTGASVVLRNNGGNDLTVSTNGPFAFSTSIDSTAPYAVTIFGQPAAAFGLSCSVTNGSGTVAASDITSVVVSCQPFTSCNTLHAAYPALGSGQYTIDIDGAGAIAALPVYCDMTFDDGVAAGGWTLYMAIVPPSGPDGMSEGLVSPGSNTYMPLGTMQALASISTQVHLRSPNDAANRSITSTAGSSPIVNLRNGNRLNDPPDPVSYLAPWTGPYANSDRLFFDCGFGGSSNYPNVYWACDDGVGLHILQAHARWMWQNGDTSLNEAFEVYMR
jgi:hypothetical protein